MAEILKVEHLNKYFGDYQVLNDINLAVEKGDIYGVLGLSGAGKSTLVRCLNGLEKHDSGHIYFHNQEIDFDQKTRRNIAMIFQQFNLLSQRTVLKNVELAGELVNDPDREKKAIDLLEKVGLKDKLNSYPSELSGGQAQRVAIARALMCNPEILLCDEATSALDPNTTNSILDLLKQLNKDLGLTIIIISHQMSVIESICNKVAIIDNSKIVENGKISDIFLLPKSEITKKMIYANNYSLESNKNFIKIIFDGSVDVPVVSDIIQKLGISISIVYAQSKKLNDKVFGQLILEVLDEKDLPKLIDYLKENKISYTKEKGNE